MESTKKPGQPTSRTRSAAAAVPLTLGAGVVFAIAVAIQIGCSGAAGERRTPTLALASASFSGDSIPPKYSSCNGQDGASPELSWKAPPEGTQSFALIVTDKDSPFGFNFVHWVLYNIPSEKRE